MELQNTLTATLQRDKTSPTSVLWPSQMELQNTQTAYLQRLRLPQQVSQLDTKSDGGALGKALHSHGPLWLGMVVPDKVLFLGVIELNCVLMLN